MKTEIDKNNENTNKTITCDDFNVEWILNKQEVIDIYRKKHSISYNNTTPETIPPLKQEIGINLFESMIYNENKTYRCIKKWEGVIKLIKNNYFVAYLFELEQDVPEIEAEIPFEEISPQDRKYIKVGASFYWNIYYVDSYTGRERGSKFIFHRTPILTKKIHREIFNKAMDKHDRIKKHE